MFGAGNEPTTIEEFYARIPMGVDLNAYNEGEVIHMDVQSIVSVGRNAFNGDYELGGIGNSGNNSVEPDNVRTDYLEVIGGATYFIGFTDPKSYIKVFAYDKEKAYIGVVADIGLVTLVKHFTLPSNAFYVRYRIYKTDGITLDNVPNVMFGIYVDNYNIEPYREISEDLSIVAKYFPQGMKSAGTAHDEIRYNKQSGKWEKVVRIGEVDLGSLTFTYAAAFDGFYSSETNSLWGGYPNFLCSKYAYKGSYKGVGDKECGYIYDRELFIKDSAYTDAASFKAAMAGVILYYELAEPIVTELDEADQFKDLDYQVWNCGTEKAIVEGKSAPLAADITYGFNAIGKIKELESLVAALRAKVGI